MIRVPLGVDNREKRFVYLPDRKGTALGEFRAGDVDDDVQGIFEDSLCKLKVNAVLDSIRLRLSRVPFETQRPPLAYYGPPVVIESETI